MIVTSNYYVKGRGWVAAVEEHPDGDLIGRIVYQNNGRSWVIVGVERFAVLNTLRQQEIGLLLRGSDGPPDEGELCIE